jgi:FkbM family methyltransferase
MDPPEKPVDTKEDPVVLSYLGREVRMRLPDRADHIQRLIASERSFYELDMLRDMATRAWPTDGVAVDVGANIGNHTLFLAAVLDLRVVALEPLAACRAVLQHNLALNGLADRVQLLPLAAGAVAGRGTMVVEDPRNSGKSRVSPDPTGDVELVRLDDLALPGPVVLLKVDVERMEVQVLQGALALLARDQPLVYVEASEPDALVEIRRLLGPLGYRHVEQFNWTPTYLFLPVRAEDQRFDALMARLEGLERFLIRQQAGLEHLASQEASRAQEQVSLLGMRADQAARDQALYRAGLERLEHELHELLPQVEAALAPSRAGLAAIEARLDSLDGRLESATQDQVAVLQDARGGLEHKLAIELGRLESTVAERFDALAETLRRRANEREARLQGRLDHVERRIMTHDERLGQGLGQLQAFVLARLSQLDDLLLEGVRLVQLDHRLLEAWFGLPDRLGRPWRAWMDRIGQDVERRFSQEVRLVRRKVKLRTRLRRLVRQVRSGTKT